MNLFGISKAVVDRNKQYEDLISQGLKTPKDVLDLTNKATMKFGFTKYAEPKFDEVVKYVLDPRIDSLFDSILNNHIVLTDNETFLVSLNELDKANNILKFGITSLKNNKTIVATMSYYYMFYDMDYVTNFGVYANEFHLVCKLKNLSFGFKTLDIEDFKDWGILLGGFGEGAIWYEHLYATYEIMKQLPTYKDKDLLDTVLYKISKDNLTAYTLGTKWLDSNGNLDKDKVEADRKTYNYGRIISIYFFDDVCKSDKYSNYSNFDEYFADRLLHNVLEAAAESFKIKKDNSGLTKTVKALGYIGEFLLGALEVSGMALTCVAVGAAAVRHPIIAAAAINEMNKKYK